MPKEPQNVEHMIQETLGLIRAALKHLRSLTPAELLETDNRNAISQYLSLLLKVHRMEMEPVDISEFVRPDSTAEEWDAATKEALEVLGPAERSQWQETLKKAKGKP